MTTTAPQACLLSARPASNRFGRGVVTSLVEPSIAAALTQQKEAQLGGAISPEYGSARKVSVLMDNGDQVVFTVPKTLDVKVGDGVATQNIHRDLNLPCNFVPPLITADLGPTAARASPSAMSSAIPSGQEMPARSPTSDSCTISLPYAPRRYASGTVVSEITADVNLSAIARDEALVHGKLDPAYVDMRHVRVVVSDGNHPNVTVPAGLTVRPGDRVAMQDAHRSRNLSCAWVPNLITDDFGPAPSGETPSAKP